MVLSSKMSDGCILALEPFCTLNAVPLTEAGQIGSRDEGFVSGEVLGVFEILGDLVEISGWMLVIDARVGPRGVF